MVLVGSSLGFADDESKWYIVVTVSSIFCRICSLLPEEGGVQLISWNILMPIMSKVASGCQGNPAAGYQASPRFQFCQSAREAKEKW